MVKKIIFGLLLLLLVFTFTKSLSAQNVTLLDKGTITTNTSIGYFFYIQREIIEWRTISKTIPHHDGNCIYLGYNPILLNQVGTEYLVKFAQIEWKGVTKEFELERTLIKSDTVLERQISESPISITRDN